MLCPACQKENSVDAFFCNWCSSFLPSVAHGKKANLFARWVAWVIDPLIAVLLWIVVGGLFAAISPDLGVVMAVVFPLVYFIYFLKLLGQGLTPGKKLLGLRVVDQQTGAAPGFGRMFLREIVGRFLSGLILGLGYLWALFDKSGQAWHDKLAGTTVLKTNP